MINPYDLPIIIPHEQRQEFILWCCTVHGKNAGVQAKKCGDMFDRWENVWHKKPFDVIRERDDEFLRKCLMVRGIGQYDRIVHMWRAIANMPDITLDSLMNVKYIGPKTAHFIMLYLTGGDYPVLDRHVMRWMGEQLGNCVPNKTPGSIKSYLAWANVFSVLAKSMGTTVAELDKKVWNERAKT
jgi:thermostable 8-oxoguanine DNA glycosylase